MKIIIERRVNRMPPQEEGQYVCLCGKVTFEIFSNYVK